MDKVFDEEQRHLTEAYGKLKAIEGELKERLEANRKAALDDIEGMNDDLTLNFDSHDKTMETLVEMESISGIVDVYNQTHAIASEKLNRTRLLLQQPYFAKVRLRFEGDKPTRDIYLGRAGMDDETRHHFIVDWRSPIAEVYYNQANGRTSYVANGRTIECDLELRRQFDIEADTLKACFDTTVAIEDPLLLDALSRQHSDKLTDITATIQREQNEVVRHADVPALLVNGIAGSGKTSVMLQRIAYLFYQERESLDPDQVYLFTPTPLFGSYIDGVLPDMGESNPEILTWRSFIEEQGLAGRRSGDDVPAESLRRLEAGLRDAQLGMGDLRAIAINGRSLIDLKQVHNTVSKYARIPLGHRLSSLVCEGLHEKLSRRLKQLATDDTIRDEIAALEPYEQSAVFGSAVDLDQEDDEEAARLMGEYVRHRYAGAHDQIDSGAWLRLDRLGIRVSELDGLSAVEWLFCKLTVLDAHARDARYVMVDEVQDYTEAQLMVLARYFKNAHFLLLGDQHQAIRPGTATFDRIGAVFRETHGDVDVCRLLTSYRSASEVTDLFASLLDESERSKTSSVQRQGEAPVIAEYDCQDAYAAALQAAIDDACAKANLVAVVAANRSQVRRFAKLLGDRVQVLGADDALPVEGAVLIDLQQAKGLEFDRVIIPDAQADAYPDEPLARRRLYTAISRATQAVTIMSHGPLTPLLKGGGGA